MANGPETIRFWRGSLPHWEVVDGRYFVTVRLHGSLPAHVVQELSQMGHALRERSDNEYLRVSRLMFVKMEEWLHQTSGTSSLRQPEIARVVADSIGFCHTQEFWHVSEWVVMPNHVHLFFRPGSLGMSDMMKKFKEWTSREANRALGQRRRRFWQDEWFDHWSRSAEEDEKIRSYIRSNPVRAGLAARVEDWPYGSWSWQLPGRKKGSRGTASPTPE